jgi:hypothetical protein
MDDDLFEMLTEDEFVQDIKDVEKLRKHLMCEVKSMAASVERGPSKWAGITSKWTEEEHNKFYRQHLQFISEVISLLAKAIAIHEKCAWMDPSGGAGTGIYEEDVAKITYTLRDAELDGVLAEMKTLAYRAMHDESRLMYSKYPNLPSVD